MYLWDIPLDVKVVMLACTHYPRIVLSLAECLNRLSGRPVILKTIDGDWLLKLGKNNQDDPIFLVDSSISILHYIKNFLDKEDPIKSKYFSHEQHVFCTDSPKQFEYAARFFTHQPLRNVAIANFFHR
jgi:glutamate racemase